MGLVFKNYAGWCEALLHNAPNLRTYFNFKVFCSCARASLLICLHWPAICLQTWLTIFLRRLPVEKPGTPPAES